MGTHTIHMMSSDNMNLPMAPGSTANEGNVLPETPQGERQGNGDPRAGDHQEPNAPGAAGDVAAPTFDIEMQANASTRSEACNELEAPTFAAAPHYTDKSMPAPDDKQIEHGPSVFFQSTMHYICDVEKPICSQLLSCFQQPSWFIY